jgi:hypothetical protein
MELTREDITSERFIHMCLLVEAEAMVAYVNEAWKDTGGHLPCLGFAWPAEHLYVKNDVIKDMVTTTFSDAPSMRSVELRDFVRLSKAYALLVIEQRTQDVKIIFESMHGSRSWTLKIEQHGDAKVLSKPTVVDNNESIGLLWRKNSGSS